MRGRHVAHKGPAGALLFGGLVGAGVALMAAPRSGAESRQRISEFAEDIRGKAECYAGLAKGKVTSTVWKGGEYIRERKLAIAAAVEAGREAYKKEKEKFAKRD